MFNTLKYVKKLEATGMTRDQAELFVESLVEIMLENLATKEDIRSINQKIDEMSNRLTIKLGSLLALGLGLMSVLQKIS